MFVAGNEIPAQFLLGDEVHQRGYFTNKLFKKVLPLPCMPLCYSFFCTQEYFEMNI